MKTIEKIKKIEDQRKVLISRLVEMENILSGSYNTVYRKCGKPNCWCKDAPQGHSYNRYIWRDKETGATRTKATHDNDEEWVKLCTANYRKARETFVELESLNNTLLLNVKEMIEQKIEKTEKNGVQSTLTCKNAAK